MRSTCQHMLDARPDLAFSPPLQPSSPYPTVTDGGDTTPSANPGASEVGPSTWTQAEKYAGIESQMEPRLAELLAKRRAAADGLAPDITSTQESDASWLGPQHKLPATQGAAAARVRDQGVLQQVMSDEAAARRGREEADLEAAFAALTQQLQDAEAAEAAARKSLQKIPSTAAGHLAAQQRLAAAEQDTVLVRGEHEQVHGVRFLMPYRGMIS